jgi:hypothetical protein
MITMLNQSHGPWTVLVALWGLAVSGTATSADLTLQLTNKAPPAELSASFREILQPKAIQLVDGNQPIYEFWFRTNLPLKQAPEAAAKALAAIPETTVLGAICIHKDQRDYREDEVHSGVYTMRLGLRPDDGNHLGTSDYSFFAVLVPVTLDTALGGITTYKELVTASRKETSSDHPIALSLRPSDSDQGEFPRLNVPAAKHKSIVVKIPAQVTGATGSAAVVFDLVYEGVAKH